MTNLHETAYPRLKADPSDKELADIYTPTASGWTFINTLVKRPIPRAAVMIQLKLFQRLGYFIRWSDIPVTIRDHLVAKSGLVRSLKIEEFRRVEAMGSWQSLMGKLREYLDVRVLDEQRLKWLEQIAITAASTKYLCADIINVLLEELVHHRYVLPAFSTLDRLASHARDRVHTQYFAAIADQLNTDTFVYGARTAPGLMLDDTVLDITAAAARVGEVIQLNSVLAIVQGGHATLAVLAQLEANRNDFLDIT